MLICACKHSHIHEQSSANRVFRLVRDVGNAFGAGHGFSSWPTGCCRPASFLSMRFRPGARNWIGTWILLSLVAMVAACGVISPRRIVGNNPSPTPSPTDTPTPTVTPTPTPTGMVAIVPKQFLFTSNPDGGLILGFEINRDGGLSPVPGSPFVVADAPQFVAAEGKNLFVAGKTTLSAFAVDEETGTIERTDSVALNSISALMEDPASRAVKADTPSEEAIARLINNRIQITRSLGALPSSADSERISGTIAKDITGKFAFALDRNTGTISTLDARNGAPLVGGHSYSAGQGTSSITIVVRH